MQSTVEKPGILSRAFRLLLFTVFLFLLFELISLDLTWQKQAALGVVSIVLGLVINHSSGSRLISVAMMLLSISATFRYGWWRMNSLITYFTDPGIHHPAWDSVAMLVLVGAEIYTTVIMILGYMQTVWPLERRPAPMPSDEKLWPHVDVLIPTYNEPLSLVRYTALAALNIDYPPDRLHVYILDDGTRADYEVFCAEAGVGYVTRPEHSHAKAGNINHALEGIHSPFVAIFDCDHVPTRSFLQMTLGWMLADEKTALVQTPHYFYSPDPFERNLLQYKSIPNEAELFYGIVQDGNDFWDATFFCGSCAVIRRSALDEVGGIAVETVTEDAHTSLRLQRRGYSTAYINIPLAAGLATETLSAHVGQRIRWARGMIQILRTDNPLFGRGLNFFQRLCYFNAMTHFLYALPRLIFLLSPLVYLLTGHSIIPGYWVTITVYALPHLYLSSLTNSRVQSWHRHSFWNEIYEAVLAPYILAPTLLALINPKLGKFNVTAKGGILPETRYDRGISTPTRWLLLLNFVGLAMAPYRLLVADPGHPGAVTMNVVWVLFNIVILGVAAAVAHEHRQRRESVRIEARIPVTIVLPSGQKIDGETRDMSVGGAKVAVFSPLTVQSGVKISISFPHECGGEFVRAVVVGTGDSSVKIAFQARTITEYETLARALYSRADAWLTSPHQKEIDRPLVSLGRVIVLSGIGLYQMLRSLAPEKSTGKAAAFLLALLLFAGTSGARRGNAAGPHSPAADLQAVAPASATAHQSMTLADLDVVNPIEMRGPHSYYSVSFTASHSLIPHQTTLHLHYTLDPALDPRAASLRIHVNGVTVATLLPVPGQPQNAPTTADISIPEMALVRDNTITFEFTGNAPMLTEQQSRQRVYSRIFPESSLDISGDALRLDFDLARLPLPVFDSDLRSRTEIPFVLFDTSSRSALTSAGIVASWLGVEAGSRLPHLTTLAGVIPSGNAVLVGLRSQLPPDLGLPEAPGPLLALRNNPTDPYGTLLVVSGDDDAQLISAASTLALTGKTAVGRPNSPVLATDTALPGLLALPLSLARGAAPRWMQAGVINPIAPCPNTEALETEGSRPVRVYFHLPPNLFLGEQQNISLLVNYKYDARHVAPGSAMRIFVNGNPVSETPLPPSPDLVSGQRTVLVPVADLRPFGNTISFNYDFVPLNRDPSRDSQLLGVIQCNSTLDLRQSKLWTRMPNLELFSSAGFPFTDQPDLSRTAVVLPSKPMPGEIALYLELMAKFGAHTGYPALRVTVADPTVVLQPDLDYLVLGTAGNQPAFDALAPLLPVVVASDGHFDVRPKSPIRTLWARAVHLAGYLGDRLFQIPHLELPYPVSGDSPDALIEQVRSPLSPDRSIVVVEIRQESAATAFVSVITRQLQPEDMIGPLSLLRGIHFESYQADVPTYEVGSITWYERLRIFLAEQFLLLLAVEVLMCLIMARFAYRWLAYRAQQRLSKPHSKP